MDQYSLEIDYSRSWSINCPKCSKTISKEQITCKNCGGSILTRVIEMRPRIKKIAAKHYCSKCNNIVTPISCTCGCNLDGIIQKTICNPDVKQLSGLKGLIANVICIGIFLLLIYGVLSVLHIV
jgi:hypothetical protein